MNNSVEHCVKIEKNKKIVVCVILYILLGGGLFLQYDYTVASLYFTTIPITYILWAISYKLLNNFSVAVYMFFLFLAQGINPFLFFIYKDNYPIYGYDGVGSFDFTLITYYKDFFQVILISIVILCVTGINKTLFDKFVKRDIRIKKEKHSGLLLLQNEKIKRWARIVCVSFCVWGCLLSVFMYNRQIGVLGFESISLPFHLVGIMYYGRLLIINGIVLCSYVLGQSRYLILPICVYSYIVTLSANSKLCGLCVLVFVVLYEMVNKKYLRTVILALYAFIVYDVLNYSRYVIFWGPNLTHSITGRSEYIHNKFDVVLKKSFVYLYEFIANIDEKIFEVLHSISSRLFGAQILAICSQYDSCTFSDFIYYLINGSIYIVEPDLLRRLLKIEIETMGYSLGHIGDIIILGCGNVVRLCIIAGVIGILLNLFDDIMRLLSRYIMDQELNIVNKFMCIVLVASFWLEIVQITFFIKLILGGLGTLLVIFVYRRVKYIKRMNL